MEDGETINVGPFWSKDFSALVSCWLERLYTHLYCRLSLSGSMEAVSGLEEINFVTFLIWTVFVILDPECPIPRPWWKRYVDNVISIVKKNSSRHLLQPPELGLSTHTILDVIAA